VDNNSGFDQEIHKLLIEGLTLEECSRVFLLRWRHIEPSFKDLEAFSIFMIQGGLNASLVKFLAEIASNQNQKIPWGHFVESLYYATPAIPEKLKRAIIDGASEQKSVDHLTRSHMLDHFDESLVIARQSKMSKIKALLEEKKRKLLEEVDLLRSQGLESEEEKLIAKLRLMYPKDEIILALEAKSRERKAFGLVIDRREREKRRIANLYNSEKINPDTRNALDLISKSMMANLKNSDGEHREELQQDFAIAQLMWENYDAALSFLDNEKLSLANFWLRQELLIASRNFSLALDELDRVEKQINTDPEVTFAAIYLRAQALWGLGEKNKALKMMEELIGLRPDYRSAIHLRDYWRGELLP
jgi:tetratricopeptide (TPR) repeat protein